MPGVDTIEALTAAVRAFDAQPLGLEVDADAEAAVHGAAVGDDAQAGDGAAVGHRVAGDELLADR